MPVRVLVVDDSAFARKVLRQVLSSSPDIEVVGIARDGLEALEKIAELQPDVVTLDLAMPHLDGIGVLQALPAEGAPRVVVASISGADTERGLEALENGAIDVVTKPTALATDRLYELSGELIAKVLAAAAATPHPAVNAPAPVQVVSGEAVGRSLVVVGTSTGGPPALTRLITGLPANFPVPMAVALHIPEGYTAALARRLDEASEVRVIEAEDGLVLVPGLVAIAPGGRHLKIERQGESLVARVETTPLSTPYRPSVDELFRTAARAAGSGVLGVVLTGMGDDGLEGARAIHAAGGEVLTEAASSCVVYGMPRSVAEAGLSAAQAPIEGMAAAITKRL